MPPSRIRPKYQSCFALASTLSLVGLAYAFTLAPSVVQIDSGELAAVQATLGIAHPTGYPLFTLIGHVVSQIPLGVSKIVQLNGLAAVWCLLSVGFFWGAARRWLSEIERSDTTSSSIILIASAASLFLASSTTFWIQATSVEVYSLHICLMSMILYTAIGTVGNPQNTRQWLILAALLGLAFGNHMTSVLIIPGLAYLFFTSFGLKKSWGRLIPMAAVFLVIWIGLLLYLPVRAAQNPALNWGNPRTLEALLRHITGRQYSVWLFASSEAALKNLGRFVTGFPGEFSWAAVVLGGLGLVRVVRHHRRLAVFSIVTFLSTILYSVNYDIHDLDAYFLLACVVFALWISSGILWLHTTLKRMKFSTTTIGIGVILLAIGVQAANNYPKADQSDVHIYEDYTKQALQSLPKNAMLLGYQWDYLISPAYYFQFVEGHRKDVAIVDKELLRRSWYFHQLETTCPELLDEVRPTVDAFLEALQPFERGGDYDAGRLESLFRRLILRLVETNLDERTVFLAPELVTNELQRGEIRLPPGVRLVPDLFFFRAVRTDDYVPLESMEINVRLPKREDRYIDSVKNFIAGMLSWRALYEKRHGKTEAVEGLTKMFVRHFPSATLPSVFSKK